MNQVTLSVKKAAWYEAGAWSVEVRQGDDVIRLYWKDQPVSVFPRSVAREDELSVDVAQELAVVLHAALQSIDQEES